MARLGLKHVRLCVAPTVIMTRRPGRCGRSARSIWRRPSAVSTGGLLVLVDIHNEDRAVELDPAWQILLCDSGIAGEAALAVRPGTHDAGDHQRAVFDRREEEWNTLNGRLAAAIRENAPQHTIVTSGPNWGGIDGLGKLKLLADSNVVYSFHVTIRFPSRTRERLGRGQRQAAARGAVSFESEAVAALLPGLEGSPESRKMVEDYGKERWNKESWRRASKGHRVGVKTR